MMRLFRRKKAPQQSDEENKHSGKFRISNTKNCDIVYIVNGTNKIEEWLVETGSYVNEGQDILKVDLTYQVVEGKLQFEQAFGTLPAIKNGFIEILCNETILNFKLTSPIYAVYKSDEDLLKNRFSNEIELIVDGFTSKKSTVWKKIGLPEHTESEEYKNLSSFFSFPYRLRLTRNFSFYIQNIEGRDWLVFEYSHPEFKLNQSDVISFLFENKKIISFKMEGTPFSIKQKGRNGVRIPISRNEIEMFKTRFVAKVRYIQNIEHMVFEIECPEDRYYCWYAKKSHFQHVIMNMFIDYDLFISKNLSEYHPLELTENKYDLIDKPENNSCSVYLMYDTVNNYYKIGISNRPQYREKTLQSEKPTIELLISKEFPNRDIASSFEKALHETYQSKRLRGEWFEFSQNEVNDLLKSLR